MVESMACTRVQLSKHGHERNIRGIALSPARLSIIVIAGCVNIGPKGFTVIVFGAHAHSASSVPGHFRSSTQLRRAMRGPARSLLGRFHGSIDTLSSRRPKRLAPVPQTDPLGGTVV